MSLASRIFRSEGPDPETVSLGIPLADAYELLKEERRQWTLQAVADGQEGQKTIGGLAVDLAAHELDKHPDLVDSKERKARYVTLLQSHLPKLDKAGLVNFNKDRGTIRATPDTHEAVAFMDVDASMVEAET